MALLDDHVREEVKRELAGLPGAVKLLVFTQEFECDYCAETRSLAEELSELSDRIEVEVHDLLGSKAVAEVYGIDKIPAIVVLGEGDRDYGIRFFGVPAGYEFSSLLEAIKMAASGDSGLSPEAKEALAGLKNPVHIQVFVTLTCPYCPMAVQLAHRCAVESELVRADMIEASEFPHLANRYGVYAVPKVVMNERVSFEGALPEKAFVDYLLAAGS
jgi:glutaredoxin-like protein